MTVQSFPITGMTCSSCVRRVEKALSAVPGVQEVHVDLTRERATISHVGVDVAALVAAVVAKGYGLVLDMTGTEERRAARIMATRVAVAWLLTLPLLVGMMGLPLHLPWVIQGVLAAMVAFGCGANFFNGIIPRIDYVFTQPERSRCRRVPPLCPRLRLQLVVTKS